MSRARRLVSGVVVATLLLVADAGCGTGDAAPTSAPTSGTTRPRPLPSTVPLVPGRVLARTTTDAEWYLWIASPDPRRGYREARQLLVRAGFVITKDREGRGGGDGQLCTERLCVNITGQQDPVFGASVAYEVFHPSGVT